MPQVLAAQGYRTASVGKIHLAPVADPDPESGIGVDGYESPEAQSYWSTGKRPPLPYYGYQQVRLCDAHGSASQDYLDDLVALDPGLPGLLDEENALAPPSGAPSSWKSAMPEEHHSSTWVADESIKLLEQYVAGDDPFFLTASIPDPHFPYCPPAPWCDMYDPASVPLPRYHEDQIRTASAYLRMRFERMVEHAGRTAMEMPEAHLREIIAHTYGMVSLLDKQVGRLIDSLKRLGLAENTIVAFTTDHGEHLGDHGFIYKVMPYDELYHLPLIWWAPGRFGGPRREPGIVSHVDLMPTMLDLAQIDCPRGVQGRSYRQSLDGADPSPFEGRPWAYIEDDDADGESYLRTLWTGRYRMSYYLPHAEGMLFDLESDPHEYLNRWHDPALRSVRCEMTELMLRAAIEAADPAPPRLAIC